MNSIAYIAFGLAVVLVATAGLAMVVGAERARDVLVRGAVIAVVIGLTSRVLTGTVRCATAGVSLRWSGGESALLGAFLLGHTSLAVFLLVRRAGPDRSGFLAELEAARGRERVRLTPPIGREDVR